jgi:hypothetical protein
MTKIKITRLSLNAYSSSFLPIKCSTKGALKTFAENVYKDTVYNVTATPVTLHYSSSISMNFKYII